MPTSMVTVVVTGAAGILGSRVVQQFARAGYHVLAVVRTPLAQSHPLRQKGVSVAVMDFTTLSDDEFTDWLGTIRPRAFVHCMALTDLNTCECQPTLCYSLNVHVTRLLARACSRYGTHFLLLSTEYVFDGVRPAGQLYCEDDPVHPLNHYGMSKAQAELAVQEECQPMAIWTICRTAVIYGGPPWSRPDFTQWLRAKVRQQEPLRLATDQISSPTSAVDLSRTLVTLVQERVQGMYHTAGGTPIDRYHFALAIARVYDLDPELMQPVPTARLELVHPRPLNVGLAVDKVSSILGHYPRSLADDLIAWREQECVEQGSVF